MKESIEKITKLFKGNRALPLLLIGLAAGLLLIFFGGQKQESTISDNSNAKLNERIGMTAEDWAREQEDKITALLKQMKEVKKVSVAIMPENSAEYTYAQNGTTSDTSRTKEYLVIDRNGETTVLVNEICPHLRGIAVVAPGIGDAAAYDIMQMLSALYDLPTNHIYVSR